MENHSMKYAGARKNEFSAAWRLAMPEGQSLGSGTKLPVLERL
jgi:hypothetical protein